MPAYQSHWHEVLADMGRKLPHDTLICLETWVLPTFPPRNGFTQRPLNPGRRLPLSIKAWIFEFFLLFSWQPWPLAAARRRRFGNFMRRRQESTRWEARLEDLIAFHSSSRSIRSGGIDRQGRLRRPPR
ncbi:MAG: hypothetical protein V6Z81_07115 [Parvularculales bacterium]